MSKALLVLATFFVAGVASADNYYGNGYDNPDYGYNNGYDNPDYGYYNGNGSRQVFNCESSNQRTVYCNIDTRYGVSLYRQLSSSACIEGSTWGRSSRGVWVSNGCRAQFVIGDENRYGYGNGQGYDENNYGDRYGYGGSRVIRCESVNSRTVYCNVGRSASVRLIRRLSQSACIEGSTWGRTSRSIWVSNGCRGEFRVSSRSNYYSGDGYYGNGYGDGYGNGYGSGYGYGNQRVVCESRDGRYNFCRTGSYIRQAQVYRQLSSGRCEYNYSWGYRSDGIWVDNGCRAEFLVY